MLVRVGTMVGAVAGWAAALVLAFTGALPHERSEPLMMLALSVALISSACLALQRHQRPLGAAYELGYDMGRRDAIREATQHATVTPIRRTRSLSDPDVGGLG